jgi:hypothetical protein
MLMFLFIVVFFLFFVPFTLVIHTGEKTVEEGEEEAMVFCKACWI